MNFDSKTFSKNFKAGKTQLVWRWIPADLETPVSAYLKLCAAGARSFLLESVEGGNALGRYSVIGFAPDKIWQHRKGDRVQTLKDHLQSCKIDIVPESLPPMAVSGLFGYIGYDCVRMAEDIPDTNPDPVKIPDAILMRPTVLAIFDNVRAMICVVTPVYDHARNAEKSAAVVLKAAEKRVDDAVQSLGKPLKITRKKPAGKTKPIPPKSNMTPKQFMTAVDAAKEHIRAGDIFQVVLSQRFSTPFKQLPFALYRSLRRVNPSPFLFYFNFGGFSLIGSSPEILVRVRGGTVTIRPIAGTRPRGKTPEEDKTIAAGLLADPKERAEHLMLLDLGRNDVGRVAEIGSVKVTDQCMVEQYSHVMHIVSNVEGKLHKNLDVVDALFAGFPAGTVSGAPKVRAMQIIDDLETLRRGYYGGGVGYFSGNGEMDSCIALRTALVKDGMLHVQAGAGIVADSDPQSEYQETVNKAKAIFRAAEDV